MKKSLALTAFFVLSLPTIGPYLIHCQFIAAYNGPLFANLMNSILHIICTTYERKNSCGDSNFIQATVSFSIGQKGIETTHVKICKRLKCPDFHFILVCANFLSLTVGHKNILSTFDTTFSLFGRYQIAKNLSNISYTFLHL